MIKDKVFKQMSKALGHKIIKKPLSIMVLDTEITNLILAKTNDRCKDGKGKEQPT